MKIWTLLLVIEAVGHPTFVTDLRFETEAACVAAVEQIQARAHERNLPVQFQCFHGGRPPVWPL